MYQTQSSRRKAEFKVGSMGCIEWGGVLRVGAWGCRALSHALVRPGECLPRIFFSFCPAVGDLVPSSLKKLPGFLGRFFCLEGQGIS